MSYGPVVPTLKVTSIPASLAFYEGVLDFSPTWRWSEAQGFDAREPTMVCIERGEAVLFLSSDGGGERAALFIELAFIEDVDRLAAHLRGRAPYDGPADRPWGSRELRVEDPDGHSLRFSCPIERGAPG